MTTRSRPGDSARAPRPSPHRGTARRRQSVFSVEIAGEAYLVRELPRQPGDEARAIFQITAPEGDHVTVADCHDWHECDCPEFRAGNLTCRHIAVLSQTGSLRPVSRWTTRHGRPEPALAGGGGR